MIYSNLSSSRLIVNITGDQPYNNSAIVRRVSGAPPTTNVVTLLSRHAARSSLIFAGEPTKQISSIIAFAFFNVRKKALCFSGDVGSISMAYIISLLIIQVMITTDSAQWILLVGVYGLDSVGTIVLRLIRGEKVWLPHRTHFYQFLVNEKKYPHVLVSLIYAISQFILSIILSIFYIFYFSK